ncbi:MAG: hypothetical protein V1874_02530 [Spirochaetota bacterium]
MTVKPIDIQTNISHMHEVAKGEHVRSAINIEGQHKLEKDAEEEANRIKNKLDANKHAEKTTIMREEARKQKKEKKLIKDESKKNDSDRKQNLTKFINIGLKIDVKR